MTDWVRMDRVMRLERRAVIPDISSPYREIGVRSFGRGLFVKDTVTGADLGDKRVFGIHPGDLVVSNIFGWEGAVALASDQHAGTIGSHRFMTWVGNSEVHVPFVLHYLLSDHGLDQLRAASPGSAGRNRTLSIENFKAIRIPLPALPKQRHIAGYLGQIEGVAHERTLDARAIVQARVTELLDGLPRKTLNDLVRINPRPAYVASGADVLFVPMAAVSAELGEVTQPELKNRGDLGSGYRQAMPGDLLFARITPCMQNGKAAVVPDLGPSVAYGSTEFHVLRGPRTVIEWVHQVLRTDWFIRRAEAAFTGTAGQQRVPASFLERVEVPLPDDLAQATRRLLELSEKGAAALSLVRSTDELLSAILPAARNEVFSALR